MAVKDLVHLYEQGSPTPPSRASTSHRSLDREQARYSTPNPAPTETSATAVEPGPEPQPRRARFLNHGADRLRRTSPIQPIASLDASPSSSTLVSSAVTNSSSRDLKLSELPGISGAPRSFTRSQSTFVASQFESSTSTLFNDGEDVPSKHEYPPRSAYSNDYAVASRTTSKPTTSSLRRRAPHPHRPIPAPTLFARDALPLSLPNLDCYLSSLPVPVLSDGCDDSSSGPMFPPLDQLAKTGKSLDDLETNSTVAPVWRNRSTILGGILNTLIGLLVGC